jgi:hypothetical protein
MLFKSIYVNNETQLLYTLEHFNKNYSPKLNTNLVRKENFHNMYTSCMEYGL